MQVYKKEAGMWARVPVAVIGGIITVYAARGAMKWGTGNAQYIWAGIVFALCACGTLFLAFFHRKMGDVLIDTENEMRKVVWPTREEVRGSTVVVITTVAILGATIYAMDIGLAGFFRLIHLYR